MNYRLATILSTETHTADITKPIDIDLKDPISQLIITHEPTSVGSSAPQGHPARCIANIELVDGSDVLFALSGVQTQALDFYHNKFVPANMIEYLNGAKSRSIFNINFGRYLYDPLYAFDPTKFSNPKLNITIDVNGGGIDSVTGDLTVMAEVFDEKTVTPLGFMMSKEIKSSVLSADTHEYTDLPTDFPYRKLFIRAQRYGTHVEEQLANIKLSEDTDKRVVFNNSMSQIVHSIGSRSPIYSEFVQGWGTTSTTLMFCTPCNKTRISGSPWREATLTTGLVFYYGGGGRFSIQQAGAGPNWSAHIQGWMPHGVIEIPFGLQDTPEDWYDVTKIGNLKLDVTASASPGTTETCEIFLQQLRRYAA